MVFAFFLFKVFSVLGACSFEDFSERASFDEAHPTKEKRVATKITLINIFDKFSIKVRQIERNPSFRNSLSLAKNSL
jgi:hypothetical protein